jgi:hypothetical protein
MQKRDPSIICEYFDWFMVFNETFNNISVIYRGINLHWKFCPRPMSERGVLQEEFKDNQNP